MMFLTQTEKYQLALVGMALALALLDVARSSTSQHVEDTHCWELSYRALDRLEDGKPVTIPRWHGEDLTLVKADVQEGNYG
jgi:hypothetical protein